MALNRNNEKDNGWNSKKSEIMVPKQLKNELTLQLWSVSADVRLQNYH